MAELGLIQVYTGDNKGKTTAALGQVIRAIGHGYRAAVIQFMKGSSYYGEVKTLALLAPAVAHWQYGRICEHNALISQGESKCLACGNCFVIKGKATDFDRHYSRLAFIRAWQVVMGGQYDLVVLDEILNSVWFELTDELELIQLLEGKPSHVELIMTGRNAGPDILSRAHLVTEMKKIVHPYDLGIKARRGIEY